MWNLNGFIHTDALIHVDKITPDKEFYHIILKNKRRVSIPRHVFLTSDNQNIFNGVNHGILSQAYQNVIGIHDESNKR